MCIESSHKADMQIRSQGLSLIKRHEYLAREKRMRSRSEKQPGAV